MNLNELIIFAMMALVVLNSKHSMESSDPISVELLLDKSGKAFM